MEDSVFDVAPVSVASDRVASFLGGVALAPGLALAASDHGRRRCVRHVLDGTGHQRQRASELRHALKSLARYVHLHHLGRKHLRRNARFFVRRRQSDQFVALLVVFLVVLLVVFLVVFLVMFLVAFFKAF